MPYAKIALRAVMVLRAISIIIAIRRAVVG